MKKHFPRRIVLGKGYPWANGVHPGHFEIVLRHSAVGGMNLALNFPKELWSPDVPKYRLVLERMNRKRTSVGRGTDKQCAAPGKKL